jgi:hypothetical protein
MSTHCTPGPLGSNPNADSFSDGLNPGPGGFGSASPAGLARGSATGQALATSKMKVKVSASVEKRIKGYQLTFPFVVIAHVDGLDVYDLLWEHWVKGAWTLHFTDGTTAEEEIRMTTFSANPDRREFGDWYEDLQTGEANGPRPVKKGGNAKSESDGAGGVNYTFEDAPGKRLSFSDEGWHPWDHAWKPIRKITFDLEFEHKLWKKTTQFHTVHFKLKGSNEAGNDTREIDKY